MDTKNGNIGECSRSKVNKKQYALIDIMKFCAAVLVVILHVQQNCGINVEYEPVTVSSIIFITIIKFLCHVPVPFFFAASSYFLFKKVNSVKEAEKDGCIYNYCKRLLLLYGIWYIVYSVICPVVYCSDNVIKNLILLFVHFVLRGTWGASWFLMASIIDALLIRFLTKRTRNNTFALIIAIAAFIVCLVLNIYNFLLNGNVKVILESVNEHWKYIYKSFPMGLIYMMIGKVIADHETKIHIGIKWIRLLLVISAVLAVVEWLVNIYVIGSVVKAGNSFIMLPVVTAFLLLYGLNTEIKYKNAYKWLRNSSTIIYCMHIAVIKYVNLVLKKILAPSGSVGFIIELVSVISICIICSLVIIRLSNKYKWMRYMY